MPAHQPHVVQPLQRLQLALPRSDGAFRRQRRPTSRPVLLRSPSHPGETGRGMGYARLSQARTSMRAVRFDRHLRLHWWSVLARHETLHREPQTHDRVLLHFSAVAFGGSGSEVAWMGLNLGIQILDVGLAVHEHDLIAALTAKADVCSPSDRHMTLEIRLLRFSTGQPHPLAEQPIIFITTKSLLLGHCNVLIEIVGDFLALLVTFPWAQNEHEDMFFLVRWKKGDAHCLRSSEWGAYAYFSFLSQDTLVIPNLVQNTLEIAKIVVKSDDIPFLVPLCVLNLPTLTRRASIVRLGCRAEPNPPALVPWPFQPRPSGHSATNRRTRSFCLAY
ncbi:hypothetical protein BJV77DRAFT_469758 [Russula vinacea]|nr:hypothetical protein BJV77DRAFT_469758 [Russula vinacea]